MTVDFSMLLTFTTTKLIGVDTASVVTTDASLLAQGVQKCYANYTIKHVDGSWHDLSIVAATISEVEAIQKQERETVKARGGTMRRNLRDVGAWTLVHIIIGKDLDNDPEGTTQLAILADLLDALPVRTAADMYERNRVRALRGLAPVSA